MAENKGAIGGTVKIDTSGITSLVSEAKTRNITLAGVRAGVRVLQAAAKAMAPRRRRSGALRQAQGVIAKKGKRGKTVSFAVQGARKRVVKFIKLAGYQTPQKVVPAFYDHLVLGGTRAHRLGKDESLGRAGRRTSKRGVILRTYQTSGGKHPGSKANPYRKRAWESVKDTVGQVTRAAMKKELEKIIEKEAAKLRK